MAAPPAQLIRMLADQNVLVRAVPAGPINNA
jgi:hypothetical protein